MTTTQANIVTVGLILLVVCALFPPRMYIGPLVIRESPAREFLFSPHFARQPFGKYGAFHLLSIDPGRLLCDVLMVTGITGIAAITAGAGTRRGRKTSANPPANSP